MATYRENLIIRREAVAAELAALDSTKLGGKANVKHEDGGTTIDHIQYKKSLYEELKAIDDELLSDAVTGDPFEESTFGELW